MSRRRRFARARITATACAIVIPVAALATDTRPLGVAASGETRMISSAGTASFGAGTTSDPAGVENPETPGVVGSDGAAGGRSHSGPGSTSVGAVSQPAQVTASTPGLLTSFDGLNHFQNRFGTTSGSNQFSLEPPDQGLCAGADGNGNTRVVEVLNDVMRVYTTAGAGVTKPTALNRFLNYTPAIVRSPRPITFGPFVTDPSCLYDAATGRWFLDVLTLDTFPHPGSDGAQHFTGTNHLDLAVSNSQDPAGSWTIYRIPVQDDGTGGTPNHGCSAGTGTATPLPTNPHACFGDFPHIGSDTNGIYLTTNEYSFFGNEFHGAQVYAFSKTQLESGASSVSVTQFDTHGMDPFGFALNGFTLAPSTTPGGLGDPAANGTEYFLSSNAGAEAHDTGDGTSTAQPSTQMLVWAITNTGSLTGGTPSLGFGSPTKLDVGLYAPPPASEQKAGKQPLRDCLNNNKCSTALEGIADPFAETSAALDSSDSRMMQTTWVNGHLWGALDTGLSVSSSKQAGIEWFNAEPSTSTGSLAATLGNEGYLALGNNNLTYPAIGLTSGGTGVMAFTVLGTDFYPSAGYATLTNDGVGAIHLAAEGAGPDDGFSNYKLFGNPPGTTRPRWGDYGAAVAVGNNVWIASEYIGQTCDLATFQRTSFRCGNTRTALANWDTRISEVSAP